jgi:general secretion pathway protein C
LGTDASASTVPLRLQLIRTLPGQSIHTGQALLGVDRQHPQTYLAGAILENGARLEEIHRDHVVLVKGSHRVSLYVTAASTPESITQADALTLVGGPTPTIQSPHLSLEPVTDFLRPVPVYRNGVIAGFQVYPGTRPSLFTKWGLQPGDVMTDLDGQPVSDADQLMDTLRSLLDGAALIATLQRAGAPVSIRLEGSDVEQLRTASNIAPGPPPGAANP